MPPAQLPDNEQERMSRLFELQVLDTEAEAVYDAITRTVARVLKVPIALVSLVDSHRQWFKSRVGVDAQETPRDLSFCTHVVAEGTPIVVTDALTDERFADNPYVTGEPRVRFYAAMPLRTEEGFVLGTLCAIDHEPRNLTAEQRELLEALAEQVTALLELRRRARVVREQQATLGVFARFFELSVELLCTLDSGLGLQHFNAAWTRTLGWTPEELRTSSIAELIHPDDRAHTVHEIKRLLRESSSTVSHEMRLRHRSGHYVPLSWSARAHAGTLFGAARDLTQQKAREATVRAQEAEIAEGAARLRAVFEAIVEGVVVQAQGGAIIECNPAAESLFGLPREQLLGRSSLDPRWRYVREDGSPYAAAEHPAMITLQTGEPVVDSLAGIYKPNGELTWVAISSRPLRRAPRERPYAVVTTLRDVTQQRAAADRAARMARQERMVTTGTLAAGVGHEINNPLSYVLGNIEFALEELQLMAGGSPSGRIKGLTEVLGEARQGTERIRKIVRGLLSLAREEGTALPVEVHDSLESALNMAMHELRPRAAIWLELPHLPPVLADESRLTQVFASLLVNAAQAFESADPSKNRVTVTGKRTGDSVWIRVSDNGPGIAPDVLPRIFDPFFTTKSVGDATGLGLSISHSVVTGLGGELRCQTELGRGTTFSVRLPVARSAELQEPAESPAPSQRGRVLLVDDDPAVSRFIVRVLERDHGVDAELDARAAFRRLEEGQTFDLILCDMTMAFLSGPELYERAKALDTRLARRFVFMTGGTLRPEMRAFLDSIPNQCLEKPITNETLRAAARRVIDAAA